MLKPNCPSVDDLLLEGSLISSIPLELSTSSIPSHIPKHPSPVLLLDGNLSSITNGGIGSTSTPEKSSRQRGLDELDLLGEDAIKSHLPTKNERSPQFAKKNEKLSMNELKHRKMEKEFKTSLSKDPLGPQMSISADLRQTTKSPPPESTSLPVDGNNSSISDLATALPPSSSLSPQVTTPNSSKRCDKSSQDTPKDGSSENVHTKDEMITSGIPKANVVKHNQSKGRYSLIDFSSICMLINLIITK